MKAKTTLALVLVLCGLAASFSGLELRMRTMARRKVPGAGLLYVPSGKYLKYATFGFSPLVADIVYLWAIQYYGNEEIADRYDSLLHIFGIISELDPRYVDPYEVGALIAVTDMKDLGLALKIFDLGFAKNPDRWIFPFEAGHYAWLAKDYASAKSYFKKAMDVPGAPAIAKRLYADTSFRAMDLKTAWETWREVHDTATDEQIRKIASNHLYQVKAAVDIGVLREAAARFRERTAHWPAEPEDLVRAGLLAALPKDYDDADYVYNPATGEFRTAVLPWKR